MSSDSAVYENPVRWWEVKQEVSAQKAGEFAENGLAPVKIDEKYGFINQKGKVVIKPQFDYAWPFMGKVAVVIEDGKFGLVHQNGKIVAKPQYTHIDPWAVNGRIAFYEENGALGYFDEDGKIVIPARYIRCTSGEISVSTFVNPFFGDGYTVSHLDRKTVVIDRDGNHLIGEEDDLWPLDYGVMNTMANREKSRWIYQ